MTNVLSILPRPILDYLSAEKARNAFAQSNLFEEDATVSDEGRDYHGRDEIRAWKEDAQAKYQYELEPLDASVNGNIVTVVVRLSGNFPGSPVEVDHTFTLSHDKIVSLAIH